MASLFSLRYIFHEKPYSQYELQMADQSDKLSLSEKVVACLRSQVEKKFTSRQIAEWIYKTYPDECRAKQKRSSARAIPLDTEEALITQISAEIASQRPIVIKNNPCIKITEGRPRAYYWTEKTEAEEIAQAENPQNSDNASKQGNAPREHDLYPLLSDFLFDELDVYSLRIDEKRSSNTRGLRGNQWLFPDLVGLENLSSDWDREIRDCVRQYADKRTRLWSFEVKLLINGSNVREVFFQTVSNSSWANFGYLVATEIEGSNTLKELRILSGLHGIGLIHLNSDVPSESTIVIPAKERYEIDWNVANRLAMENKDFLEYIKLIRQFYQTGEMRESDWKVRP